MFTATANSTSHYSLMLGLNYGLFPVLKICLNRFLVKHLDNRSENSFS